MYRVVHLGVGDLAHGVLKGLLASEHKVVGVLYWDAQESQSLKRRAKRALSPDIYSVVDKYQLPQLTVQRASSPGFSEELKSLNPDVLIVSGWGEILKKEIIEIPHVACINVHPALLPTHRGSNPVSSVLRENEKVSGVTFHYMVGKIDGGDIIEQAEIPVSAKDNADTLSRKISFKANELVATALSKLADDQFSSQPQDSNKATYFPRISNKNISIDWSMTAEEIYSVVRGYYSWANCFTRHNGQSISVLSTDVYPLTRPCDTPGKVIDKLGVAVLVATGDPNKALFVNKIQLSGLVGKLKSKYYVASKINIGDVFK